MLKKLYRGYMLDDSLRMTLFRIYEPKIGTGVQVRQLTFWGLLGQSYRRPWT